MANPNHRTRNPSANTARADDTTSYGRSSRRPPRGSPRWSRNSSKQELESPSWKKPCEKPGSPHLRQGRINPAPSIPESMDYRCLGLKVGLEIHQQLAKHKLFCEDASVLIDSPDGHRFRRRLRPTQSELGEVDAAAIEEAKRRLTFVYEATPNSCLVEADEEPPHPPNPEALDIALEIALLLEAKCASEVDFMRKIVIDGSNTSGFQRSALVALDGHFETGGKRIGVPTILLEEDAAEAGRGGGRGGLSPGPAWDSARRNRDEPGHRDPRRGAGGRPRLRIPPSCHEEGDARDRNDPRGLERLDQRRIADRDQRRARTPTHLYVRGKGSGKAADAPRGRGGIEEARHSIHPCGGSQSQRRFQRNAVQSRCHRFEERRSGPRMVPAWICRSPEGQAGA